MDSQYNSSNISTKKPINKMAIVAGILLTLLVIGIIYLVTQFAPQSKEKTVVYSSSTASSLSSSATKVVDLTSSSSSASTSVSTSLTSSSASISSSVSSSSVSSVSSSSVANTPSTSGTVNVRLDNINSDGIYKYVVTSTTFQNTRWLQPGSYIMVYNRPPNPAVGNLYTIDLNIGASQTTFNIDSINSITQR